MEPFTMAAIALAPTLLSMMNPAPGRPGIPDYSRFALPDRKKYQEMILQSGFNPQSDLYRLASDRMMEDINSQMVNRGLGNSSQANMMMSQGQADLGNKFLEGELQRRINALNSVANYDIQNSNIMSGLQGQQSQADWQNYNSEMQGRQQMYGGMSNAINTGLGFYGQSQAMNQMDLARQQNQANFDRMMGSNAPSGGSYSFAPQAPAFQGGMQPYRPY